jgi:hypothetical protein
MQSSIFSPENSYLCCRVWYYTSIYFAVYVVAFRDVHENPRSILNCGFSWKPAENPVGSSEFEFHTLKEPSKHALRIKPTYFHVFISFMHYISTFHLKKGHWTVKLTWICLMPPWCIFSHHFTVLTGAPWVPLGFLIVFGSII